MFTIPVTETDNILSSYNYDLPPERIAQYPVERGTSRLLVFDRNTGERIHTAFPYLPEHLPQGALLIANNSKVVPVRMLGRRATGGKMECLLLTPIPLLEKKCEEGHEGWWEAEAEALVKPAKHAPVGARLDFGPDFKIDILAKGNFGRHWVKLHWQGSLQVLFEAHGHLPLPPYIRRKVVQADLGTYQTVYARNDKSGSVAAPTAGLHFTPDLRQKLFEAGFEWKEVTLHVGYGTFSPVRCDDITRHVMHEEFVEVPEETAAAIMAAKKEGRPVIAVGTTSARTLEAVAALHGGKAQAHIGWINCFIRPGYMFSVIDGLITNFHLPESTLLMLVAALTGRERILEIYKEAVERQYRFFSYGDAMFIK